MTEAEKAYQYFVVAVPENEEQAKAYFWARKALQPTLTPPNEPLTCEGCIHEEKEHQNCNYCMRASYLGDYYYRCLPEGEEE